MTRTSSHTFGTLYALAEGLRQVHFNRQQAGLSLPAVSVVNVAEGFRVLISERD